MSRIPLPASAGPPVQHRPTGVVYIDRQGPGSPRNPSVFLLSFGGSKDGVGTFRLGRAVGLNRLGAFLKRIGVSPADVDTALDALAAHQGHQIANVRLMPDVLRSLGS